MSSYKDLQKRAERLGLNLWENGGYYYVSGFIRGKHRQGIFNTLKEVESQLSDEARYQKIKQETHCPECGHKLIPCSEEYSAYTKGYIKPSELMCQLHGSLKMIKEHGR